jgi:hypothetical protein
VKSRFRILATGVVASLFAATSAVPAVAAGPQFAFSAYAGGTQISAVGTAITSSVTAQSALYGMQPGQDTNKVASVKAAPLANVGAVSSDVTSVAQDDGFKVTSHVRAADVSLLNGAIKVQAIDTTSTASASHGGPVAGDTTTQLLGLTIAGKQYPVSVPRNTGVTIPGVASVMINQSQTAIEGNTVVTMGGGLVVTLLSAQGGAAAGAVIIVNPTFIVVQPSNPNNPDAPSLGGSAFGLYAEAHAGDSVQAETGRIANLDVPTAGTDGNVFNNHLASANIGSLLSAGAVDSDVYGVSTAKYAKVTTSNKIANLNLFNTFLFGGLIQATAIGTNAHVEMIDDDFTMGGSLQFVNLRIAGKAIPIDVAPNTKIHVANLGTVTINERRSVSIPGFVHGYEVTGLHIVLDTAGYGLPVGADVKLGLSQAIVWR